jgi:hypothetical protein
MRPTLPSAPGRKSQIFRAWLMSGALAACHHADPPVAPGDPLPASTEITVDTMEVECTGLVTALDHYATCPNLDDDERTWLHSTSEFATQSYEASQKGHPDAKSQQVIALACRRAALSVQHATERCQAGPKPRQD